MTVLDRFLSKRLLVRRLCPDNQTSCRDDINTLGHKLTIETIEPVTAQTNDDENNNRQTPVYHPLLGSPSTWSQAHSFTSENIKYI